MGGGISYDDGAMAELRGIEGAVPDHALPPSAEDASLQGAFGKAQNGFQGPLSQFLGQQVIDIKLPEQWRARPIVVTLTSMKAGGINADNWPNGNPSVQANSGATVANLFGPPDNQVATQLAAGSHVLPPPEVLQYQIFGVYLTVEWGVGNVRERAYVSYPYGGGSFQLQAATVRVQVPSGLAAVFAGAPAGVPFIGGFASPGERSQVLQPPTLCSSPRFVVDGTLFAWWAPPRARGYRLYTSNDLDAGLAGAASPSVVLQSFQVSTSVGGPGVSERQLDGTNVTAYSGNSNELDVSGGNAWQRATRNLLNFTPLHPLAVGVVVSSTNSPPADGGVPVGVEWLLDLG